MTAPVDKKEEEWTTKYEKCFVHLFDEHCKLLSDDFHDAESANRVRDAHNFRLAQLREELEAAKKALVQINALKPAGLLQNKELLEDIYEWLDGPIAGERSPHFAREVFHAKLGKLLGKEPVEYGE